MEDAGKLDKDLIKGCFELGLMGIEVPETLGGADGSLFMVALAVEEISKIDPLSGRTLDRVNEVTVYPASIFVTSPSKQLDAIWQIQEDMVKQVEYLKSLGISTNLSYPFGQFHIGDGS